MTFDEYFAWEKENVIHLESRRMVIDHPWDGRTVSISRENKKIKKTTATYCVHCGAPVNPYKEQCEYCGCYY